MLQITKHVLLDFGSLSLFRQCVVILDLRGSRFWDIREIGTDRAKGRDGRFLQSEDLPVSPDLGTVESER